MDVCDRCPQPAKIEWWKPEGKLTLGACWHHAREWGPTLLADGWLSRTALPALTAEGSTH